MNLLLSAGCVAFVYSYTFGISKACTSLGAVFVYVSEIQEDKSLYRTVLKSRSPNDWMILLKTINDQMSKEIYGSISKMFH